jgi:hypothetical protein
MTPGWNAISPSSPCSGCWIQLDPAQVYNRTWHDSSCNGCSASVSFNGTSGTLYGVGVSVASGSPQTNNYSFVLNGKDSGFMLFNRSAAYIYNLPLFSFTALDSSSTSTLAIYNWQSGSILLDYLVYDNGEPTIPSSVPSNTPSSGPSSPSKTTFPVAAVVVPLCIVMILLAFIIVLLYRRRRPGQSSLLYHAPMPNNNLQTPLLL